MSDSGESLELAQFRATLTDNYITYVVATLVIYEYLSSFPAEVEFSQVDIWLWRRLDLTYFPTRKRRECGVIAPLQDVIDVLVFVVLTAFATIRVYALRGRNKWLAALSVLSGLVPIVISIYIFTRESIWYRNEPVLGVVCDFAVNLPNDTVFACALFYQYLGFIIMDFTVLLVTMSATTYQIRAVVQLDDNLSLGGTLLRDGSLYFITLVITNIAEILINIPPAAHTTNPVGSPFLALHPLLISRFLLNLQRAYHGGAGKLGETARMRFSRFSIPMFKVAHVEEETYYSEMGMSLAFDHIEQHEELDEFEDEKI
ncbi:hypothetical protein NM688_g3525 [Phlebia brevispora]|uniref:Uncharacterized protein n=1 Tax=Phlebia brevispora TaxID=194682 RepID=A0ACC1T5X3_9APHY|nr:hypothetical protein NM688_g3525 [Phlebia brevispora]